MAVYWQPIGWPVAQVGWLGRKVGSHLAPCCIHRVNRVKFSELSQCHDDGTINIVIEIIIIILLMEAALITYCTLLQLPEQNIPVSSRDRKTDADYTSRVMV